MTIPSQDRRSFLKLSSRLAALGLASMGANRGGTLFASSHPIAVSDYKALVCIYLNGGNDSNNMIVPRDSRYTDYMNLRGGLALSGNKLKPDFADQAQKPYALHYGLSEIHDLYSAGGPVAFVLNMGVLEQPTSRTDYQAGTANPTNLFSHADQTVQAQTGVPTQDGTGWGGRLLDFFGNDDSLAAVSMSMPSLFLQGYDVGGNAIPPGTTLNLAGMNFWQTSDSDARKKAVADMLLLNGGNTMRTTANKMFADGLHLAETLQQNGGGGTGAYFPPTGLGDQLAEVFKMIKFRSDQGPGRQVFFCQLDGFDLHSGQDWMHWFLLSTLSQAMAAFYNALAAKGLGDAVTTFTQSEFSRTFQPSGTGSDHAWGGHTIVLGGGVKGGVYGQMPKFEFQGPNDANNRGVWIPTISTSQFGATLGRWFGADDADVKEAFGNLTKFTNGYDIGFMKP